MKLSCIVRPYENERGATDRVYNEGIRTIEKAIVENEIIEVFKNYTDRILSIKTEGIQSRPVIGIAGDIYTRANPVGNEGLFKYLEDNGLQVLPAPFIIDVIDYGLDKEFYESVKEFNISKSLFSGMLLLKRTLETKRFRSHFGSYSALHKEPTYRESINLANKYFWNEYNELLMLNISKMVDFKNKGVSGIINAMCLNCMIETASSAISEKIKDDNNIPVITLVYSNTDQPSRNIMLDAFIDTVKNSQLDFLTFFLTYFKKKVKL